MAKFQKIGHNIDIKGLVIHQVNKTQGESRTIIKEATSEIVINENEKRFISNVHEAYYKKSSPNYGIFGGENIGFRTALERYCKGEADFLQFSKEATLIYKSEISKSAPATGGFIIFGHYHNTSKNTNNLLVLTTNNKDGFAINESNLTIKDIKTLDMSKIDVACMINLTKWQEVDMGEDVDSDTYLSFVRGNKEVSVYFMTFIDCNDKTTSTLSSRRLLNALNEYSRHKGYSRDESRKKKNDIYVYCDQCITEKRGIQLSGISSILDPDNPDEFTEFASDESRGVSAIISGKRAELKSLRSVYYKDENITIGFDRSLLDKSVKYNANKKELTFKNIPQELIEQILL